MARRRARSEGGKRIRWCRAHVGWCDVSENSTAATAPERKLYHTPGTAGKSESPARDSTPSEDLGVCTLYPVQAWSLMQIYLWPIQGSSYYEDGTEVPAPDPIEALHQVRAALGTEDPATWQSGRAFSALTTSVSCVNQGSETAARGLRTCACPHCAAAVSAVQRTCDCVTSSAVQRPPRVPRKPPETRSADGRLSLDACKQVPAKRVVVGGSGSYYLACCCTVFVLIFRQCEVAAICTCMQLPSKAPAQTSDIPRSLSNRPGGWMPRYWEGGSLQTVEEPENQQKASGGRK